MKSKTLLSGFTSSNRRKMTTKRENILNTKRRGRIKPRQRKKLIYNGSTTSQLTHTHSLCSTSLAYKSTRLQSAKRELKTRINLSSPKTLELPQGRALLISWTLKMNNSEQM
jgi:hypothetical protein